MDPIAQAMLANAEAAELDPTSVALGGAGLGALAALPVAIPAHALGNQINNVKDALAARQGLGRSRMQNLVSRVRPGIRMATIVPAALGGAGILSYINQNTPTGEAALLARYQSGGLNQPGDQILIENALKQYYGRT